MQISKEQYQEALDKLCSRCYVESEECTCHARYKGGKCYDTCEYRDLLQELVDQQTQPTFDECIKEWEEKGYEVENSELRLSLRNIKENIDIYIQKRLKEIQICVCHYNYAKTISFDLHNLIHKTLKALEVDNA